jgi:hypothetical protein
MQIQSFGGRRNVYTKGNASTGASSFCPLPYFVQHVYLVFTYPSFPATDLNVGFVVRKFQRGLNSMENWYERWNIKINEDKTQGISFFRSRRPPESHLTLNG